MKIGAIGFYTNFNHNNIENIKYSSEQTILEYDMLIINVNNIYEEYEIVGNYQGIPSLTHQSSRYIRDDIDRRKKEYEAYLNSGRSIIVITPYSDKRTIYTGKQEISGTGRSARITNIVDFIDTEKFSPMGFNTIRATGENIEFINKNAKEVFNKYIDCFEYNSFTDKEHVQNPIAKITGTDEIVFWYENINNGIVMFMPDVYFSQYEKQNGSKKEKNFLEDIYEFIQNINKKSMQDIPKWLSSYETSEEKELNKKINKIDNDIKKLTTQKEKLENKKSDIDYIKRLFTASGEELEDIVKKIFEMLGFNIVKSGGNEEDLVCELNGKYFILEIKGVDGTATEKHTAQTLKWRTNYFINTSIEGKGVLVINGFKNKELNSRNNIFPNQILKYAKYQNLCLLSTVQLFNIFEKFKEGKITVEEVADNILNQNGIYEDLKEWDLYIDKK